MNNEQFVKDYYKNNSISNFYKKYWGGESIHIGIYHTDYIYNSNKDTKKKLEEIKNAIENKTNIIYNFINTYEKFDKDLEVKIADFGSGFGGSSRIIYKNLCKYFSKVILDNYDISEDNCAVNTEKNLKEKLNIGVYNISFLKIPKTNEYYDIIFSEDAFIHINDRESIFLEVSRVLKNNGYLIFSDIILDTNFDKKNIDEVYKRVNIKSLETLETYKQKASNNGLIYINSFEYRDSMLYHYSNIRDLIENSDENKIIIEGLENWIKHIKKKNITTRLFFFKKFI